MRRWLLCVALVIGTGCVRDELVPCGEQLCPIGTECTPGGCAQPKDVAACAGLEESAGCTLVSGPGTCSGGSCHAVACGNGIVDVMYGEACDDGNQIFGDGCSADCRSRELCGNDVIDVVRGEECDRGVAGLASDGCTSVCTFETELWREGTPTPIPSGPVDMAYDEARGVTVVFGRYYAGLRPETWEYDGLSWVLRPTVHAPPVRGGHAIWYDPQRRRIVLFGGSIGLPVPMSYADTWEYDGIDWTQRMPATSPPPIAYGAVSYDSERKVAVLYGGFGATIRYETWEYDGTTWANRTPITGSPLLGGVALAFDPVNKRTLLFGGYVPNMGQRNQTWSWDGTTWTQVFPPGTLPIARVNHAMVTDSLRSRIVLVAGNLTGTMTNDSWSWNGTQWIALPTTPTTIQDHGITYDRKRDRVVVFGGSSANTFELEGSSPWSFSTPGASPNPREGYAMAYDPGRGRTLLFGGCVFNIDDSETWQWDGYGWRMLRPTTFPSERCYPAAAYDGARDRVVLFGGTVYGTPDAETWLWDGVTWKQVTPATTPPPRGNSAMAYDAKRGRAVMFGGAGTTTLADTWEWDGTSWTELAPPTRPSARYDHAMAYDPVRERVVLYGGTAGLGQLDDLWEWDGSTWTQHVTTVSPGPRSRLGMTFDPIRRKVVLFGGMMYLVPSTDTAWEWDGVAWTVRVPPLAPPGRGGSQIAYDAINRRLMTFSGDSGNNDTWLRGFEAGGVARERCLDPAADDDADGRVGCDDPDCFGRCTPLCIPGLPCDPALPRCGDGACGAVEDYVFCPSDCTPPP